MKLIDVDRITDEEIVDYLGIGYASCADDVRNLLADQPVAYDLEAVLNKLNDYAMWKEFMIYPLNYRERMILKKVVEIVKRGGRNEV